MRWFPFDLLVGSPREILMGHWGASGLRSLQTVTLLFPHVLKIFPQDIQAFSVSQAFAPDRFRDLFRAHLA